MEDIDVTAEDIDITAEVIDVTAEVRNDPILLKWRIRLHRLLSSQQHGVSFTLFGENFLMVITAFV